MTKHKVVEEEVEEKPKKVKQLHGEERVTAILDHLNKHGYTFPEELHNKEDKDE